MRTGSTVVFSGLASRELNIFSGIVVFGRDLKRKKQIMILLHEKINPFFYMNVFCQSPSHGLKFVLFGVALKISFCLPSCNLDCMEDSQSLLELVEFCCNAD